MVEKVTATAIKEVLTGLFEAGRIEREKSESYQNMFRKTDGVSFTGLLRDVEHQIMSIVLDACHVIETKTGKQVDNELFRVLKGFPLFEDLLEKDIDEKEGMCCCVDKAYYLLNEFVKQHLTSPRAKRSAKIDLKKRNASPILRDEK